MSERLPGEDDYGICSQPFDYDIYCMKCRKKTSSKDCIKKVQTWASKKRHIAMVRNVIKGHCSICGSSTSLFCKRPRPPAPADSMPVEQN